MEYFTRKITLQDRLKQHECQLYPLFGSCLELRDDSPKGVYQSSPLDLSINSLTTQECPSSKGTLLSSGIQRLDLEGQISSSGNSKSRQSDSPVLQKISLHGTTLSPISISPPNKSSSHDESRDQPSSIDKTSSCDKTLSTEKTSSSDKISSSDKTTSCDVISLCDETSEKTPSLDKTSPKKMASPTDRTCIPERSDVLHVQSTLIGGIGKVITVKEGEKCLPDQSPDSGEQTLELDSIPNKELIKCDIIEDCNKLFKEILEPRVSTSFHTKHGERSQKSNPSADLNVVQFNRATIDSENKRRQLTSEPDRDRQQITTVSSEQNNKLCSSRAVTRQPAGQTKSSIHGFIKRNRRAILRKPKSILGVRNAFLPQGKTLNEINSCPNVNVTDFTDQCAKNGQNLSFRLHNGEFSQPQINLQVSKATGDDKELSPQSQRGSQIPSQGHHSNHTVSPSHYRNQPPGDFVSQSMPRINQASSDSQHINKISIQRPYGKETFAQGHHMNQISHLDHKHQLELSKSGKMLSQTRYRGQMINTNYCTDVFTEGHVDKQMKCYNNQSSPPSSGDILMSEESLVNMNTSVKLSTPLSLHSTNRAPGHGTRTNSNFDTGSGPLTQPSVSSPCKWYKIPQQENKLPLGWHQMKESMHSPSDVGQHRMAQSAALHLSTNKKSMPHDFTSVSEETRIKEISEELRMKLMRQSYSVPHSCSGVCLGHDVSPTKVRRPTMSDPCVRHTKTSQNIDRTAIIIDREVLMNIDYQYLLNIGQEKELGMSVSECSNNGTVTERNIPTTLCDNQGITMGNYKGRLTTDQQSSTGTDQQSSKGTDQQSSTGTDQQSSTASDHDQQMSLVNDPYRLTPTEQQRPTPTNQHILTVTDQQKSMTTDQQMSMATNQQRSTTIDQQRSTTSDQQRSMTTEQQMSTTNDQQRSITTDQHMSMTIDQQRSMTTDQTNFHLRSTVTDQQISMTTGQQRSTTTGQQRSMTTDQQMSTTTDQQRSMNIDQQWSMTIDQQMSTVTDQQMSMTTDQQRSMTIDQQMSMVTDQQMSMTTDQQRSTAIDQQRSMTTDQQRSMTTDKQMSMTTDQQRSTTIDQHRSTVTDQQRPMTIDQQRSTVTDQKRSMTTDQHMLMTIDQQRSMTTDQTNFHQRSTVTDQQMTKTTGQQRSITTGQQRSMTTDQQMSTATFHQRSMTIDQQRSMTTDQQRTMTTDQPRSMDVDQQMSTATFQQRSMNIDQQRSTVTYQQRSMTTDQLRLTANDQKMIMSTGQQRSMAIYQQRSMINDQQSSMSTDQQSSTATDQQRSTIHDQQRSMSTDHQRSMTTDQQWSTTLVQQRAIATDQQMPMSSDHQRSKATDHDHRSTAIDQPRSTAYDQQSSMVTDQQMSLSAEQLGSTANDLRWPSPVSMETLPSTEKNSSLTTAQEKSVATDFKNSKALTDDHEKSAFVHQSLSVNNQNMSTNDSDISERRKGLLRSPAADHCEQIMTSVTTHMDGADEGWNLSVSKTIDLHSDCNNCKACRRIFAKLRIPPIVSPDNPPNKRRTDCPCTVFNTRLRDYNK
ncbi:serine-rich adhesin for platelets-like [Argopecten irradians]|uniref:serine-rich adhesin for platelets-like n=1 Tax=Argopecten irradians TaxID=31199 RepID=UPI0037190952